MHSTIAVSSTVLVDVVGLVDDNDTPQNDATVTLETIVDRDTSTQITGVTFPKSLTYIPSSRGDYRTDIGPGNSMTAGRVYVATIKAVGSQGYQHVWSETILAKAGRA